MLTVLTVDFYKDVHSYYPFPWFIFVLYVPYTRLLGQVDADELKYKTFLKRLAPIYFIELSAFIYHPDWNPLNIKPLKHDIYFTEFHFMLHSHNYFPRPQNSLTRILAPVTFQQNKD